MIKEVLLRPKTNEARDIIESMGDIWEVAVEAPDPIYGSQRRLLVEKVVDKGQRNSRETMWITYPHDDLFEIIVRR